MGPPAYTILVLSLGLSGLAEVMVNLMRSGVLSHGPVKSTLVVVVYVLVATLAFISCLGMTLEIFIFVYLLIAAFDGFSQVIGQLFGRIKLCPKISPNKTIEGFLGGLFLCIFLSTILCKILPADGVMNSVFIGAYIGLTGLIGDLAASWIKRWMGIKDFSRLLPGHGGILDRFDGFLFSLACLYPLIFLFQK